jgi:hypothetical protein
VVVVKLVKGCFFVCFFVMVKLGKDVFYKLKIIIQVFFWHSLFFFPYDVCCYPKVSFVIK